MIVYELIKTVAEAYKNPAEGEEDRNGNTRLSILQEKYHLSSLKVQKILVTAGVYEPVKEGTPYAEITQLRKAGKSVKEIMEITGLSSAAVSSYIPYERGVYNADRNGAEISSAAGRKRKQRGGEETKRSNVRSVLREKVTDESFWKAIQEHSQEIFISLYGERYSVSVQVVATGKRRISTGLQQDLQILLTKGRVITIPKEKVLDILHNALELKAAGEKTDVQFFDRSDGLPYVYPLLVFFGIIAGDKAQYTTKRTVASTRVCSCCGRMADYTVNTYADLINIAKELEEDERSKWDPAERERVDRMEKSLGRVSWNEKAKKSTAAIRAFNREGERQFCTLCAETIRMALEDGELPGSSAPVDFHTLTLEAAEAGVEQYFDKMPEGVQYVDRYGCVYDSKMTDNENGEPVYLYRERDSEGILHTFVCYVRRFPGHRSFEAVEIHKLTKAGRLARNYIGTDYCFRTGLREEGSDLGEVLRETYIGFLEIANSVRDALQNPALEWHEGFPRLSNAVSVGNRQCVLRSIGEMQVVYVDVGLEKNSGWDCGGRTGRGVGRGSVQGREWNGLKRTGGGLVLENDCEDGRPLVRHFVQGREWSGGEYGFMIDGRVFNGEEVALMSSAHEEWKLQYRFADPSDPPLRRGEYLMPVQLGEKELVTEVSELLNLFTADGRFISDHDERNFDVLFDKEVLRKLKLYYESNPRGYGKLAGMKIIERLRWIEGTERQVEKVRGVVG